MQSLEVVADGIEFSGAANLDGIGERLREFDAPVCWKFLLMRTHELKTWPSFFEAIKSGRKRFEVRKNDRDFSTGDTLLLREFDPSSGKYSGQMLECDVTYVLSGGEFGVEPGHCVMSFQLVNIY